MRPSSTAIVVGILLLVGLLVYSIVRQGRVRCEVCVTFQGRTTCRGAAAPNREESMRAATTAACAVMASGVTDSVQCQATPPSQVRCE